MSAVALRGLRKVFRGFRKPTVRAVRHLDLEIPTGEVFGLLGPNGAGKSTTFWMIMGLLPPSSGQVRVLGQPAGDRLTYRRIGFQPEVLAYQHHQRCRDVFALHSKLLSPDRSGQLLDRALELCRDFGIEDAWGRRLSDFSRGMLQRVSLAQAFFHEPDLILLDEPSANLDPSGRKLVRDKIDQTRRRGASVLICSHVLSEVEAVCDRVGILDQGRLKGIIGIEDLLGKQDRIVIDCTPPDEAGLEALARSGFEGRSETHYHRIVAPREAQWEVLDLLRQLGIELLAVNPVRVTLEEAYLDVLSPNEPEATQQ